MEDLKVTLVKFAREVFQDPAVSPTVRSEAKRLLERHMSSVTPGETQSLFEKSDSIDHAADLELKKLAARRGGPERGAETLERMKKTHPKLSVFMARVVRALPSGWTGTGEDIRHLCEDQGEPWVAQVSPNSWGPAISHVIRIHLLEQTGRLAKMKSLKSNGRRTEILRRK